MSSRKRRIKRKIAMILRMDRQYLLTGGNNTTQGLTHLARMSALTKRVKRMGYAQRAIDAMCRHW